ncbi:MAG: hypothetical protein IKY83_10395 [Proteobacteria bacterium]|nr:hypothetical protein [Pseudomonadota bacterium]
MSETSYATRLKPTYMPKEKASRSKFAYKYLYLVAILGTALFTACDDDSGSSKSCGTHEIEVHGDCACDSDANYYGTHGNCTLCEGDHKIVNDNACVCDDNSGYEDDGNGGCKLKADAPKCGTGEKISGSACVCDETAGYYGSTGSCTLCEGDHKIVKTNQCICDDNGYEDDGNGGCKPKTGATPCGTGEIMKDSACVCDNDSGYFGESGKCRLCSDIMKNGIVIHNECVCDDEKHEHIEWVPSGEDEYTPACVCANNQGYYGEPGNCQPCLDEGKIISADQCICDEENNYLPDGNGGCNKHITCDDHEKADNGVCVCDIDHGYFGESGACFTCQDWVTALFGTGVEYTGLEYIVHQTIDNDITCVCDPQKHLKLGQWGYTKTNPQKPIMGCGCDIQKNYFGEPGNCQLCDASEHRVVKNDGTGTKCVCDEANGYYDDGHGRCDHLRECEPGIKRCGTGSNSSSIQTCLSDGFYGALVSCTVFDPHKRCGIDWQGNAACLCEETSQWTTNSAGDCICKASNHWVSDGKGGCICDSANGWQSDGKGGCACTQKGYYLKNGVCTKCNGIPFGSTQKDQCISQPGEIVTFGTKPHQPAIPEDWLVLSIDKTKKLVLLLVNAPYEIRYYNKEDRTTKWELTELYKWLNTSYEQDNFTKAEIAMISPQKKLNYSLNYDYPYKVKENHTETAEDIFLLDLNDVIQYLPTEKSRKLSNTNYCWGTRTPVYIDETYWNGFHDVKGYYVFSCIDSKTGAFDIPYANDNKRHLYTISSFKDIALIRPAIWVKYE